MTACTNEKVIYANAPPTISAKQTPAGQRLLDVGIVVFDPGQSEQSKSKLNSENFLEIRRAEARYIPYSLKKTLDHSSQWGSVRVLPNSKRSIDIMVTGTIIESSGSELVVEIEVQDATGRTWLTERYSGLASKYAYIDKHFSEDDPFQSVYNSIANDMLSAREKFADKALENTRSIAELRFAADLAPDVFSNYLAEPSAGNFSLNRLPADDDPMLRRVFKIRARDLLLLDTLDSYYAAFYRDMEPAYREWLKVSFEETIELKKLQRSTRNRMGMGAATVVAGVAGGLKSNSSAGQAVSTATAVGGVSLFASGVVKQAQSDIHVAALRELNSSFEADLAPKVIEIEGRAVTLTGSAEAQYEKWRQLLRQIYIQEKGLPN